MDSDSDIEIIYPPNRILQSSSNTAHHLPLPRPHPLSEREPARTPIALPKKSRQPICVETDSSLEECSEEPSSPGSPIPVRNRPRAPEVYHVESSETSPVNRSPSPFAHDDTLRPHEHSPIGYADLDRESSGSPIPVRKRPRPPPPPSTEPSDALSHCESSDEGSPIPMRKVPRTRSPLPLTPESDAVLLSPISPSPGRLFEGGPLCEGVLGLGSGSENASTGLMHSPVPGVHSDDLAGSVQLFEDEPDELNDFLKLEQAPAKYVPRSQLCRPASEPVEALGREHEGRLWLASAPADVPAGAMEHQEGTLARTYSAPQPINTIPTCARDKGKGRLVERSLTPASSLNSASAAKMTPLDRSTAADHRSASTSKPVGWEPSTTLDDESVSSAEARFLSIASTPRPGSASGAEGRSASVGRQSGMMSDDESVSSVEARALSIASTPTLRRLHAPPAGRDVFDKDDIFPSEFAPGLGFEEAVGGQTVSSPRSSPPAPVSSCASVPAPVVKRQTKGMSRAEKTAKAQEAKLAREAVKAAKAAEKQQRKEHQEANKLTLDRKKTVAEVHMCLPQSVMCSSLHPLTQACKILKVRIGKTANCAMNAPVEYDDALGLVRWMRKEKKEWVEERGEFVPLPNGSERETQETTVLVVWSAEEIDLLISAGSNQLVQKIQQIQSCYENHQLFIVIHGLQSLHKASQKASLDSREKIKKEVEMAKIMCKCLVVWVEGTDELADWLWELTLEIGVRPYKSRKQDLSASLRLDVSTKGNSGTKGVDKEDTYIKMLTRLTRVTESEARGVVAKYPTLRELYRAWEEQTSVGGARAAEEMLVGCLKKNTLNGPTSKQKIGKITSKKIYEVLYRIRDGDICAYNT